MLAAFELLLAFKIARFNYINCICDCFFQTTDARCCSRADRKGRFQKHSCEGLYIPSVIESAKSGVDIYPAIKLAYLSLSTLTLDKDPSMIKTNLNYNLTISLELATVK